MIIETQKANMLKDLKVFMNEGQLDMNSKKHVNISSGFFHVVENTLWIFGANSTNTFFCKASIKTQKLEDYKDPLFISSIETLYSIIDGMEGATVKITINPTFVSITDNKAEESFEISTEMPARKEINQFFFDNAYKDGVYTFTYNKEIYKYTPWFSCAEGSVFKPLNEAAKRNSADFLNWSTEGELLHVSLQNSDGLKRNYKNHYPVKVLNKIESVVTNIFPILDKLNGFTEVHYYKSTTNNSIRVCIINNGFTWVVKFEPKTPKTTKE
jgi:hypothetical protein